MNVAYAKRGGTHKKDQPEQLHAVLSFRERLYAKTVRNVEHFVGSDFYAPASNNFSRKIHNNKKVVGVRDVASTVQDLQNIVGIKILFFFFF